MPRLVHPIVLGALSFALPLAAAEWPMQATVERLPGTPADEAAAEANDETERGADEEGEAAEESTWDVADPPGEEREVTIDVSEGTWMNLDVSPDGREIVFDLLGDLYLLPIKGGEATALTSGMAWDMQPRFAPDGRSVAYTSDAGGGDNLWILERASGERTQVTEEDFRLLNNPAWSPDGEYLAARKHFTSNRSLGAGEIWLYHRSGGGGLQMTEKPNEQKDVGEPAFSPDGRYLYYSHDATPGPIFEYNRDPHAGIYQIARLDRETGKVDPFVVRAGGAVRPTPSPDGTALAFVGRAHGYGTALLVQDVASGAIRVLHEGLDRDHQETWAIHGVYANFAWTPDSRSIVFWSGGRLHRIDVAGGEVVEIPFHVRQTHRVGATVHSVREPAPASFEIRMLRWVEVSPSGDRALFQALGRIWLQDLSGGEPRRLTTQKKHWELYPSFSRDGRSVVYVSWDDRELGAVRIAPVGGAAEGRVVTPAPGHYVEPALSPSGTTVVYRKVAGGFLSRNLYGRDLGLYRVAVTGGEASRISARGVRPHFGADSSRVFFMTFEEENARALRSVGLAGSPEELAEREHFTSEAALEWRVSPDGRWVAFTEGFKAFVAPFAVTGKAVAIGADAESFPVEQVSEESGEYLHWSGDGARLHWSLGNTLYTRPLDDTLAFLSARAGSGGAQEEGEPVITATGLGMTVDKAAPSGIVALVGGRVLTVDADDQVIEDGTVVVESDRIVAVGPRAEVEVPAGAHVVDAAGKTVMPGIIDVHWHGSQGFDEIVPEQNWFHLAALAFGVTTIHDPSTDTSTFFAAAEMERAGLITAPRLFSTGTILYGAAGPALTAEIDSLEDARFHLGRMKAAGAFSVKSYNQPRRDQRQQVLAAARELDMLVVPEGGSLYEHDMTMVVDGHTGIEHAVPVEHLYQDVLQLWSQTGTAYTPTLVVAYGGIWGENYWYAKTDVWNNERLLTFVPREQVDPLARRPFQAPDEEYNHIRIAEGAVALAERGVRVNVGAHGQREGLAAHWEIWMLVQGGMSEMQALRAATWNGARYLGMHGHLGSLEPAKLADLIVLDRNPLEDIRNTESVSLTMVGGRLYDAATMNEVGNHPRPRAPMFWE
jgi:imidazolonepropionase-like amidohydrolase/Tol biopolymer transport system component